MIIQLLGFNATETRRQLCKTTVPEELARAIYLLGASGAQ